MIVRQATDADIAVVLQWRAERAAWLADRGESQWQTPWPVEAAERAVESGELWMVWDGDVPAASFALSDHTQVNALWKLDSDYGVLWVQQDRPEEALYISKMVVPLARASDGLGAEILRWAGGYAFDAEKLWLRLDAWTSNAGLRAWYERQGFQLVRVVPTRASGACFQKPAQPYTGWRLKTAD